MIQAAAKDGRASRQAGRFIAFWATSRAERTKGRKIALPALLYSRPTALESLLSVALSSVRQLDCISSFCLKYGLVFNEQNKPRRKNE